MGSLTLNDFYTIAGGDQYTLQIYFVVTQGITVGQDYAFRYRAINAVGSGPWSDIATLEAATVPLAPAKPEYISSTPTSITLSFSETQDNGGSKITEYKLFRDAGDLTSEIDTEVTDYNGADS